MKQRNVQNKKINIENLSDNFTGSKQQIKVQYFPKKEQFYKKKMSHILVIPI